MLKITGLALITLCCWMAGTMFSAGLTGRVSAIEGTLSLLGQMSDRLKYLRPSVNSLLEFFCGCGQFQRLPYLNRCRELVRGGNSFPDSWRRAAKESAKILGSEESEALAGLAGVLGCADLDTQTASIDYTKELLRVKLEEAREREKKYGKLYRSMGILSGIAIAIVLA